ncbi:MAG: IS4 family transposase [Proteobacteria bacterium]|nr:IS4 family transposase [Pseudomonadota bacterium]
MDDSIAFLESTTFAGRRFTRKMLAQIQETVDTFPGLSQRELGQTICEHLQWVAPNGSNKIHSCLKALEQMEKAGFISLPAKRKRPQKSKQKPIEWTYQTAERETVDTDLDQLYPVELEIVTGKNDILLWNQYVDRYHYLNYKRPIGTHLRYFIVSKGRPDGILGCLLFSATAVWSLSCRDRWIEWERKDREKRLNLVLNNNRFLIFPWVRVKHLASKALSIASGRIADDWENLHGYRPALLETFVNPTRYKGTSYQAANWQCLGKTSGRSDKEDGVKKDIYVYPLSGKFREVLTGRMSPASSGAPQSKGAADFGGSKGGDEFTGLWQRIASHVYSISRDYDRKWRRRNRIINTMLIVLFVFRLVFSKNKQGYGITVVELWEQCRRMDFPLPQAKPVAASAFCEARKKLDEDIFKTINARIIETYTNSETDCDWKGHGVFAVDGSKINLPRQLLSRNYALPSKTSHYPQGLASCLYQLKTKIPYDFGLLSSNDERKPAMNHLKVLNTGDLVIYDWGYFSYLMLYCHIERGIDAVFRIQKNTYKAIDSFTDGDETDRIVAIEPSAQVRAKTSAQRPDIQFVPLRLRLVKYTISGTVYTLGTTLVDTELYRTGDFCDLYHSRWGVEELYKISKVLVGVDDFHGHTERGVKQELFAHFLLVTLNRIFSNRVETDLQDKETETDAEDDRELPKLKVNFKNSLVAVARNLEGLFIRHARILSETIDTILESLFICKQKERPGRSYERRSMKPLKTWSTRKTKKATP